MAGELVPLVLIPRYTTYSGTPTDDFTTIGLDVTQYSEAIVNVFLSDLVGTAGTVTMFFEESTDQNSWTECTGTGPSGESLSENTEAQYTATLAKRWFRVRVVLPNANNVATLWATGFLERRLT